MSKIKRGGPVVTSLYRAPGVFMERIRGPVKRCPGCNGRISDDRENCGKPTCAKRRKR